ncbi:MAG: ATP-dependent DNA helicase [Magnetococcales bacterium]|nr:ATP-dependent DNA helicase [Magnetococcales bacterium]
MDVDAFIEEWFGEKGKLADKIPGFEMRDPQAAMARGIARLCLDKGAMMVEAATGTGKTLAYLLPLIVMKEEVIVSTATKALQDQILHKDIPLLRTITGRKFSIALLKGRSNYLCISRFRQLKHHVMSIRATERKHLELIDVWRHETQSGDRDELASLPEDFYLWYDMNAGGNHCTGQKCEDYDACFLFKARNRAKKSDLVLVNHHLFFADLAVKEEGFGEILPDHPTVIFDEAHRIPEVATRYFGLELSSPQLRELVRDCRSAFDEVAGDDPHVLEALDNLDESTVKLRVAFENLDDRDSLGPEALQKEPGRALVNIETQLHAVRDALKEHRERSADLAACDRRAEQFLITSGKLRSLDEPNQVYWYEMRGKNIYLQVSPLETGPSLREALYPRVERVAFTSATLTTGPGKPGFAFLSDQLGLDVLDVRTGRLRPVFDYGHRALLYVASDLPEPNHADFQKLAMERIKELIRLSRGRTLCLFTSLRMMNLAQNMLADELPYNVLVQGEKPKRVLLEQFKEDVDSVLFATGTFWEGVDVPGDALSQVIIDRLPFTPPDDPLISARSRHIQSKGGNPFRDLFIPQAILTLKQGAGRLLRRMDDRGVVSILDQRLTSRQYGQQLLRGLPPFPCVTTLDLIEAFFKQEVSEDEL